MISEKSMKGNLTKLLNEVKLLCNTYFSVSNITTKMSYISATLNFNDGSVIELGLIADKYNTVSCNSVTPHVDVNFKLNVSVSGLFNNLAISGVSKEGYIDLKCLLVLIVHIIDTKAKPKLEIIKRMVRGDKRYFALGILNTNRYIDLTINSVKIAYSFGLVDLNNAKVNKDGKIRAKFNESYKSRVRPDISWDILKSRW